MASIVIAGNLDKVMQRIKSAALRARRKPEDINLVAVSKTHDSSAVRAALALGQRHFGENRVQEAVEKFTPLRSEYPDLELHLIGPLQTNKASDAVKLFDVIETLDRPKLAQVMASHIKKIGRSPRFYIEINIGKEPQKAGLLPNDAAAFLELCRTLNLNVTGLMCIPPQNDDPIVHFRSMKMLAQELKLTDLSMGMSGDFEKAIECGSTEVRLGTALFGERPKI